MFSFMFKESSNCVQSPGKPPRTAYASTHCSAENFGKKCRISSNGSSLIFRNPDRAYADSPIFITMLFSTQPVDELDSTTRISPCFSLPCTKETRSFIKAFPDFTACGNSSTIITVLPDSSPEIFRKISAYEGYSGRSPV